MKNSTKSQNYPANIYLFTVSYRKRCEICPKLTIKAPNSGVFIINFEHILHLFFRVSIVDSEQGNVSLVVETPQTLFIFITLLLTLTPEMVSCEQ